MDYGEGFLVLPEKEQFMGSWIPLTPQKPVLATSNLVPQRHGNQMGMTNWQDMTSNPMPERHGNQIGMANWPDFSSNLTPERHGNQMGRANCQEMDGFHSVRAQELQNWNGVVQNFNPIEQAVKHGHGASSMERNRRINQIASGYTQAFINSNDTGSSNVSANFMARRNAAAISSANRNLKGSMSVRTNGNLSRSMSMGTGPLILNMNPQLCELGESHITSRLLANQSQFSGRNLSTNISSTPQNPQSGALPRQYQPDHNMNLLHRTESNQASSNASLVQLMPITPDGVKKVESSRLLMMPKFSMGRNSNQGNEKQKGIIAVDDEIDEHSFDRLLQNVVDSSSAISSAPFEVKNDHDRGSDQGFDLNKTPQQKPPKRKKHRPKVFVEGKPKRTSTAATTKNSELKQKPKDKRKYVRKNSLKQSATLGDAFVGEATNPIAGASAKSCRRMLNFPSEKAGDEKQISIAGLKEINPTDMQVPDVDVDFQARELTSATDILSRTKSALQNTEQNVLLPEIPQPGTTSSLIPSVEVMPGNLLSMSKAQSSLSHQCPTERIETKNSPVGPQIVDPHQKSTKNGFSPLLQMHVQQFGRLLPQARADLPISERTRKLMPKSSLHSAPDILSNSNQDRGSKRGYFHTIEKGQFHDINTTVSSMLCQEIFQLEDYCSEGSILEAGYSETHKKKKNRNGFQTTHEMPSSSAACEVMEGWRQHKTKGTDDLYMLSPQPNHGLLHSILEIEELSKRENNRVSLNKSNVKSTAFGKILPKQNLRSEQYSCMESIGVSSDIINYNNLSKLTTIDERHLLPPTTPRKTCNVNLSDGQETLGSCSVTQMLPEMKDTFHDHHQPSAGKGGQPAKQTYPISVEQIIQRLSDLNLNERSYESAGQEQHAIVPYKADGTIAPYEAFGLLKKRKPRPKVDLDPETNRLWNLLMGKEGPKSLEGTDKEKEKWWEEERKIFQGRIDSFIARMHLVQGDRRFSQWNGSVVDSVIGVFLTQNVSDHLSSSAFMSLAARFPLKLESNTTCDRDGINIFVQETEVCCLQNPNEIINWRENVSSHQHGNQSSSTPCKSAEKSRESVITVKEGTSLAEVPSHSLEEEVISSQDSFDSSIIEGIRSCSGSNSEAEDPTTGSKCNKISGSTFMDLLLMDSNSLMDELYSFINESQTFHEGHHGQQFPISGRIEDDKGPSASLFSQTVIYNNPELQIPVIPSNDLVHMTSNSDVMGAKALEFYGEGSISSWNSVTSGFTKATDDNTGSKMVGKVVERLSRPTTQANKSMRVEDTMANPYATPNKHLLHLQSTSDSCLSEMSMPFHPMTLSQTKTSGTECISNLLEFPGKIFDVEEEISKVNKQIQVENTLVEPNSREHAHSADTGPRKAKKAKADHEKNNLVDWDRLRRQAEANGRKKERNKDARDSLDYEAVRCAAVEEISDAIRERGMNNMLAERIKEFLNRMVAEHGSIDLEWLRDIDPDKAKDYLLSIRGLGLKSVECVRLLTLHQLAFPVDTNVGRIAVRLGWVPLQPLPESLQLHLLELYPILESIQKYLWPRLCKLDQRTLYELHYQMITFGKVFCTKKNPNCNACPMRAECRHFASAFASARLALPGPEEKSLANSVVPITSQKNAAVLINPVPLPLSEKDYHKMALSDVNGCKPIIEEPATPEPERSEITESDIEDSFWDDPDEIPTIKLNIDEFTANLQTYIHENMELQEGEMSKALVALNPAAPSIPTPKLKNISNLRTEHYVYELPDSHPLLKGMERRQPDDPSPYLLAIWTPGETADSIQAPDQQCRSHGPDKLCNDKTCFSCNSIREANSHTVRGTLLIPCRTAMRGSFPLNGTYFQVNEMFADHESSTKPIDVPRAWIWNLPRRIVFFGTSVSTIFKGLTTEGIQYCFWKGFVCVRGFDQKTRAPRPLLARLHFPASKLTKKKDEEK